MTYIDRKISKKVLSKLGDRNPMWVGDEVGYNALHAWIKRNLEKPIVCDRCHNFKKLDLANKSGEYKRYFSDWEWLCRKCHMDTDGRMSKLRQRNLIWSKNRICGTCTIGDCINELHGRGMCHKHYESWRRKNKWERM